MHRILFLLICVVCLSPILHAQRAPDKIACYANRNDNPRRKRNFGTAMKSLWGRHETLKRSRRNAPQRFTTAPATWCFGRTDLTWCSMKSKRARILMETARLRWSSEQTPAEGCTVVGAISFFRFHQSRISSSRSPWKARSIFIKTKTGR